MTEIELKRICERSPDCGCDCMRCEAFARHMQSESDYERYCLEQEIQETICDDIGF